MIPQPFEIATSRYQAHNLIAASGLAPIGITLGKPRFRLGYKIEEFSGLLAPTGAEFRLDDNELFELAYRTRLQAIGLEAVVGELHRIHTLVGRGLVLLCFEDVSRTSCCHRRMLAHFLESVGGFDVPELS